MILLIWSLGSFYAKAASFNQYIIADNSNSIVLDSNTYLDEYGNEITEETCIVYKPYQNAGVMTLDNKYSGHGTFRKTEKIKWKATKQITKYYAQGDFFWSDGKVCVRNPVCGYSNMPPKFTVFDQKRNSSKIGKKDSTAYVSYKFKTKSDTGIIQSYSVKIKLNGSGNHVLF